MYDTIYIYVILYIYDTINVYIYVILYMYTIVYISCSFLAHKHDFHVSSNKPFCVMSVHTQGFVVLCRTADPALWRLVHKLTKDEVELHGAGLS